MIQSPKTLEFLQKLKDSGNWNDDYDYSKVNFIRTKTKLRFFGFLVVLAVQ